MKNRKFSSKSESYSGLELCPQKQRKAGRHSLTSWYVEPSGAQLEPLKSTVEAEDIVVIERGRGGYSPDFGRGMLAKSRQRSRSLDRLLDSHSPVPSSSSLFRREVGDESIDNEVQSYALLENPENATRWYFKYFLGRVHQNFLCYDNEKTPFFLSVVGGESLYRSILWRKTGNKRLCIQHSGKIPPPKAILEKFGLAKYDKSIKDISSASLQKDFLTLEEQEGAVNFKFGVLYAKAGQATDDEMFSNKTGSSSFNQFLDLIGDTVDLLGWKHFKGGLDNRNNATGAQSVYTVFGGHEVMFHVSTLLPYSEENKQQLERKRHIGNDIVVIIFVDSEDEDQNYLSALNFNPSSMNSHFNHIFALVTYNKLQDSYRLVLYSAESVPSFGPPLPPGGEFCDHFAFRDFLLAKLINGEKAAYCISTFSDKRERTLGLLMKDVEHKCSTELRKSFTQLNPSSPGNSKKYQELEQSFTEVGNKIKIEKIVSGNHPTSQITTAHKREPWETSLVLQSFPYKIVCGDTCGDGSLIVSTLNDGAYMVFGDGSFLQIIDKSLPIAQIVIAHRHQLILFKTRHAKDNFIYAVPLELFLTASVKISTKSSLNTYQLPYTKGCHLFCTTPLESQFLRLMVAVKNKVFMLVWKYPAISCFPTTPTKSSHPLEGFVKHRELTLSEVPVMMSFIDDHPSGKLCVMYQKYIEAIDELTTEALKLYTFDPSKVKITELRAVQHNARNELLLGYNMSCSILALQEGMVFNSPEIVWNAEPNHIVYVSPYVLAFTADTIEIRKSANGSLMYTIDVPELNLISQKDDIIFTSPSLLNQSLNRVDSLSRLEGKAAKVLGKANQSSTSIHIYKITLENLLGGRSSLRSQRSSDKDEETSSSDSRSSVSDAILAGDSKDCSSGLLMKNILEEEFELEQQQQGKVRHSPKPQREMHPAGYHGNGETPSTNEVFVDQYNWIYPPTSGEDKSRADQTMLLTKEVQLRGLHSSYSSSPSILEAAPSSGHFYKI